MKRFASYDAAVTWLKSIDGYVGPVERRDAMNSVTLFGDHGLAGTSAFDTGYREAVSRAASGTKPCAGRLRVGSRKRTSEWSYASSTGPRAR